MGCTFDENTCGEILSNNGKYIREARGKFIQYKILHRYYYTPTRLNKMGLIKDSVCWKCKTEQGTYMHALWECSMVSPLWDNVLEYMGGWLECELPRMPRLCLLGDKTMVPQLSKFAFRVLINGLVTCARLILKPYSHGISII